MVVAALHKVFQCYAPGRRVGNQNSATGAIPVLWTTGAWGVPAIAKYPHKRGCLP